LGADLTGYASNRPEWPGGFTNISRLVDTMSIDIAAVLREDAKTAQAIAGRLTGTYDKAILQQLAVKLVEIAERLERDARD
jgi:hypothetical protein